MLKEFKAFILRGNVVDLAIGVVIGAAFTGVVKALVEGILTPLIALPGTTDFSDLVWKVRSQRFEYGLLLQALLDFVLVAAAIFFFVVKPVNHLMARFKAGEPQEDSTRECPDCLSKVPRAARKCAFCTTDLQPA